MLHENSSTLRQATIRCAQLFVRRSESFGSTDASIEESHGPRTGHGDWEFEIQEQLARFKIWVGSLGALASGRASADERLHDDPDIKDVILGLLHRLARRLEMVYEAETEPPMEPDEDDDDSSYESISSLESDEIEGNEEEIEDSDIQKYSSGNIAEIADLISRLYKFSTFIRKAGSVKDDQRASLWAEREKGQLQDELRELESHVRWQLSIRYPRLPESFPILEARIIHSVLQRRRRLLYRISHQRNLENGADNWFIPRNPESVIEESQRQQNAQLGRPTEQGVPPTQENNETRKAATFVGTMHTKATTLDRTGFSTCGKSAILSMISPSAKAELQQLDVPPPPKPSISASSETICPYCSQILGPEIIGKANNARWTRHLLRDIEPYICLFDECVAPGRSFRSKEEWLHHMAWNHARVWSCPVIDHRGQVFASSASLEEHLVSQHSHETELSLESNLDRFIEKAEKPSPDVLAVYATSSGMKDPQGQRGACPFCDDPSMSFDILEQGIQVTFQDDECRQKVESHIARHLEILALLSLPARDDLVEDDSRLGGATGIHSSRVGFNHTPVNEGSAEGTWNDVIDDAINRDDSEEGDSNPKGSLALEGSSNPEDTAGAPSPEFKAQKPTATFIDNRLPQVNPAFEKNPIQYDPGSGSWVPKSKTEPLGETSTMPFWNSIFGDAMARFNIEFPKRRPHNKGYDIRCRTNWTEVSAELNAARQYRIEKSGIKAIPSMKHTSDMDSISPVSGVMRVLVGDVQAVIFGRDEITHEFHHLNQHVLEAELAILASQMTDKVKSMSIDLCVIAFRGVEFAIEVFASNKGGRMETKHTIVKGGNYPEKLHSILSDMRLCIARLQKIVESPRELQGSTLANVKQYLHDILQPMFDQQEYLKQREAVYRNQPQTTHHAPNTSYFTSNGDLLDFIDIPNFRKGDMQQTLEKRELLDLEQRMRAENIVQSQQFKDWYVSTASKILLIHGDYGEGDQRVSALSVFCTTLAEHLQKDQRFITLVFFCGSHLEDGPRAGGLLVITSLVVQLVLKHNFELRWFPHEMFYELKERGNIAAFCSLFRWLLCQLPSNVTVFCLVDGAVYYESDRFVDGMSEVLAQILDMAMDGSLPVTTKVLVTSPTPTTVIRAPFETNNSLLSMGGMKPGDLQAHESGFDGKDSLSNRLEDLRLTLAPSWRQGMTAESSSMPSYYPMSMYHSGHPESTPTASGPRYNSPIGPSAYKGSSFEHGLGDDQPQLQPPYMPYTTTTPGPYYHGDQSIGSRQWDYGATHPAWRPNPRYGIPAQQQQRPPEMFHQPSYESRPPSQEPEASKNSDGQE